MVFYFVFFSIYKKFIYLFYINRIIMFYFDIYIYNFEIKIRLLLKNEIINCIIFKINKHINTM